MCLSKDSNSKSGLAHELRHAYDKDQGLLKGENSGDRSSVEKTYEQRAVGFENRIRKAMGLPLRKTYDKIPIKPYTYAK